MALQPLPSETGVPGLQPPYIYPFIYPLKNSFFTCCPYQKASTVYPAHSQDRWEY